MKRQSIRILFPVIASLAVLIVGVCAVAGYGVWYWAKVSDDMSMCQSSMQALRTLQHEAMVRQQWLASHQALLSRLRAQGWFQSEPRVEWLQRLEQWQVSHPGAHLEYHLSPRQSVFDADRSGWQPVFTRMSVSMQIVEEGEWFDFLDFLRAQHLNAKVRQCQLQRHAQEEVAASIAETPQLSLSCDIDWFGVGQSSAKSGQKEVLH